MRLLFEPLPVYFMHVPKTGGMALGYWLRASYGRGYVDVGAQRLARYTLDELQRFRCYHSWHYSRSLFELIGRADLCPITMLREPVERVVSGFYFGQRRRNGESAVMENAQQEDRPASHGTNHKPLDEQDICRLPNNAQTRILGARADYAVFLKPDEQTQIERPPIPRLLDFRDHTPPPFEAARAWLDEMAVVGLTERYTESVQMMADLLGIPAPADLPLVNANPQRRSPSMRYRDELAPAVLEQLEELNRFDLELYAHATELFEQQWARYQVRPRRTYSIAPRLRYVLRPLRAQVRRIIRRHPDGLEEGQ